jgi:cell wall-associated NlpC family hydrolase
VLFPAHRHDQWFHSRKCSNRHSQRTWYAKKKAREAEEKAKGKKKATKAKAAKELAAKAAAEQAANKIEHPRKKGKGSKRRGKRNAESKGRA